MTAFPSGAQSTWGFPAGWLRLRPVPLLLLALAPVILPALLVLGALLHTPLVLPAILIAVAVPVRQRFGPLAPGVILKRGESHQAECATSGGLEQAAAIGRGTHDASDSIKSIGNQTVLLFA
jgi:hypothetical protein